MPLLLLNMILVQNILIYIKILIKLRLTHCLTCCKKLRYIGEYIILFERKNKLVNNNVRKNNILFCLNIITSFRLQFSYLKTVKINNVKEVVTNEIVLIFLQIYLHVNLNACKRN